jgi:hypothetical protein
MATHTPITFWLSMTYRDACTWSHTIAKIQAEPER